MSQAQPSKERPNSIPGEFPQEPEPTYTTAVPDPTSPGFDDDDNYEDDIYEDSDDSEYEDAPMISPAPQTTCQDGTTRLQAPTLPSKSALRASRVLDDMPHKLHLPSGNQVIPQAAPHEMYLSSEEDASSSADDFSDFEFDSDLDLSPGSPGSRSSQEDTARMVSVVFVGKPSVIYLSSRSISPTSTAATSVSSPTQVSSDRAMARFLARRESQDRKSTSPVLPVRTSSRSPPATEFQRPEFLDSDPFAAAADQHDLQRKSRFNPGMLKKTFSLARKRSRAALNSPQAYLQDNMTVPSLPLEHGDEVWEEPEAVPRMSHAFPRGQSYTERDQVRPDTATRNRFRAGLSLHRKRNSLVQV